MTADQYSWAVFLAWRDWRHDGLLSLCSILALASMLAPVLILMGLKNGIATGMRERLLEDPTALVLTPKSDAGSFSPEFVSRLSSLPGASYAVGRTRETATDITLQHAGRHAAISLEPSTPGEPVLKRYGIAAPEDGKTPQLVLSAKAAQSLAAAPGAMLAASLGRRTPEGRLESVSMNFLVAAILPPEAADRKLAFAPLSLLEDMENYRDCIAVPDRGFTGQPAATSRNYASFRLYAASLDNVEKLAAILAADHKLEVVTHAREIAAIRELENAINQVILIISLAIGTGFTAFTLSSSESAARRKKRMLGMLRLLGFRRAPLMCFPVCQSLFTAMCGFALSLGIYALVALAIRSAFAHRGGLVCILSLSDTAAVLFAITFLSALAAIRPAWQTAALEPSVVIREI